MLKDSNGTARTKTWPGVIRYAYLWHDEHLKGREEGQKDRPCVVILSVRKEYGQQIVTVAPVTHTPPRSSIAAVPIPLATKQRLGLDKDPSWVVTSEVNRFLWPGPDVRPVHPSLQGEYAYGYLPPGVFSQIRQSILTLANALKLKTVQRTQ